jgi:Saxitoxin biosynthesis operon protein SxtJ
MRRSLSPHDPYQDQEASEAGSDRGFGCTVGSILIAIGAVKGFAAGAATVTASLFVAAGALLMLFGVIAPARLSPLKRLWLRLGTVMAAVVNPVVLAILFLLVVTPTAWLIRLLGKRTLRLTPDPASASYWITRHELEAGQSDMRRQF